MSVLTKEKEKKIIGMQAKQGEREIGGGGSYVSDDLLFDFLS
jgi:hypothetical protein